MLLAFPVLSFINIMYECNIFAILWCILRGDQKLIKRHTNLRKAQRLACVGVVDLGSLGVTSSPRDPRFVDSNPTEVD